jgi:hypothetical protein
MAQAQHQAQRRTPRLLTTAAGVVALLGLMAAPAAAAPGDPQLVVTATGPTKVSMQATGFAAQSTVNFTVTVGGCAGTTSGVATAPVVAADFETGPSCVGPAVATATAGAQSATASFTIAGSPATAAAAPAAPTPSTAAAPAPATAAPSAGTDSAQPGKRAVTANCTVRASGASLPAVKPGDTVCFSGNLPARLNIKQGGTAAAPVTYSGQGAAVVPGITARGDNIILEGFVSKGADDNGIYVSGKNITVQDNDISSVNIGTDDVDAMRFFGDNITIQHNYSHDIWANASKGGAPHTDCMQTYTSDSESASSNIKILSNKCASAQFHQCLMAEGPHDDDGDGQGNGVGQSANWTIAGNYFECHAPAQTVALQDIQNVTFSKNDFAGTGSKAIALQKRATGATVTADNIKGPGYKELVGIDDESARQGFKGP